MNFETPSSTSGEKAPIMKHERMRNYDAKKTYEVISEQKMERIFNGFDLNHVRLGLLDTLAEKEKGFKEKMEGTDYDMGYLNSFDRLREALENEELDNRDLIQLKGLVEII